MRPFSSGRRKLNYQWFMRTFCRTSHFNLNDSTIRCLWICSRKRGHPHVETQNIRSVAFNHVTCQFRIISQDWKSHTCDTLLPPLTNVFTASHERNPLAMFAIPKVLYFERIPRKRRNVCCKKKKRHLESVISCDKASNCLYASDIRAFIFFFNVAFAHFWDGRNHRVPLAARRDVIVPDHSAQRSGVSQNGKRQLKCATPHAIGAVEAG